MRNFINKKNIFWDFDGVIMDSMPIRNKGFEIVLKEFPKEQVDLLMKFHLENGGLSRYVKFRYFFEKIRGENVTDAEIKKWAQRFSKIMREELLQPSLLIKDSIYFIKENYKNFNMHIVSGSDGEELRYLCDKLEIFGFFKSVQGSPIAKKELVGALLRDYNYTVEHTVLIGDSMNDYDAAVYNSIDFCGYNNAALRKLKSIYIKSFEL